VSCDLHGISSLPDATSNILNVSDIELTYHWTTSTSHTMSVWSSGAMFWKSHATELGFAHHYVLHLIFTVTALHLAHVRPARREEYIARANHHYGLALPSVTSELARINSDNCDAVLISVQFICFVCWARGPQPGEFLAFGESGSSEWLIMFRGIRTTLEILLSENFKNNHASRLTAKERPLPQYSDPPHFEEVLEELRDWVKHASTSEVERETDLRAIDILLDCYRSRYGGVDSEYHVVFAWLYKMSEEYLARLQLHESVPLITYAYFTVLMHDMERYWYMIGWTHHVMSGIYGILHDDHRVWIRWPMAQVGWIPP